MLEVIAMLQAHTLRLTEKGPFDVGGTFKDGIDRGAFWHAEELGVALQRTASTWEAVLLMAAFGLNVELKDLLDTDCCHSYVPADVAIPIGPDDAWVLTFCELCQEAGRC